jgi:hypothetical protein
MGSSVPAKPADCEKKLLSLRQVVGFLNAPDKRVQKLAHTAAQAIEQRDEAQRALRDLQEKLAAVELEKQPILVMAWHTGLIEVRAASYHHVKVIPINDIDGNPDTAEDVARERASHSLRSLFDCKNIAAGSIGLDKYKTAYVEAERTMHRAIQEPKQ